MLAPLVRPLGKIGSSRGKLKAAALGTAGAVSLAGLAALAAWLAWSVPDVPWGLIAYGRHLPSRDGEAEHRSTWARG